MAALVAASRFLASDYRPRPPLATTRAFALGRIIISFRVSLQTAINSLLAPG